MLVHCRFLSLVVLLSTALLPAAADADRGDASNKADQPLSKELVELLKNGGHVIYFRHAATDHNTVDTDRENLANCATQRNLSDMGRRQSASIGEAFRALGIPVGAVISSPYCRCMDTARLAFGVVEANHDLLFALGTGDEQTKRLSVALEKLLATEPEAGTNTIIAGHTVNLRQATGVWPKPEGAAMIFKPEGNGTYNFIEAIHPDAWSKTAAAY